MAEPKKGTPLAAAHLRPESRQKAGAIQDAALAEGEDPTSIDGSAFVLPEGYQGGVGYMGWPGPGQEVPVEMPAEMVIAAANGLLKLREQFAESQIEKLPKPMWKGAWDGQKGSNCRECGGYHVTSNCIHLDYVGHANATNRLLDADLTWNWEPMAYTEAGTPFFSDGGLWIRLTVCGVTRIGFGDGKNPKEIIGDAIRNAAMRFGVALDLWAKINLHEERNPGDGQTQQSRGADRASGDRRGSRQDNREHGEGGGQPGRASSDAVAADAPRAANQDALDALAAVCDEHGYDRRAMRELYAKWAKRVGKPNLDLLTAQPHSIGEFSLDLVVRANAEPDVPGGDGRSELPEGAGGVSDDAAGVPGEPGTDGAQVREAERGAAGSADDAVPDDPEKIF